MENETFLNRSHELFISLWMDMLSENMLLSELKDPFLLHFHIDTCTHELAIIIASLVK